MDVAHSFREQLFVWDEEKEMKNLRKHGVSFSTACEVFFDTDSIYVDATGWNEGRVAVIGITEQASILCVVHLAADGDQIRIISARKATRQEEREYEDG